MAIIETKFKVNDLVTSKYHKMTMPEKKEVNTLCGFEVIEIQTVTCSAGTQVFYDLRAIYVMQWGDNYNWFPEPGRDKQFRLREDELVALPEEYQKKMMP